MDARLRTIAVAALALVAIVVGPAASARAEGGAAAWVRELYVREAARHNARVRGGSEAFLDLFSVGTRTLLEAPLDPKADIQDGPILDVLFGWGVLPGRPVAVTAVDEPRTGSVRVRLTVAERPREIRVEIDEEAGRLRIRNVVYDTGPDLVAWRRKVTGR